MNTTEIDSKICNFLDLFMKLEIPTCSLIFMMNNIFPRMMKKLLNEYFQVFEYIQYFKFSLVVAMSKISVQNSAMLEK